MTDPKITQVELEGVQLEISVEVISENLRAYGLTLESRGPPRRRLGPARGRGEDPRR